jgi:anti-sigma regulatory factor (Ser/Thr protein kinase)
MAEQAEILIQMMSNPLYLSGAREMVAAVARRLAFSDEACGQIALAVDEALCNVIRHGYGRQSDRPIWISLTPIGGVAAPGSDGNPTEALKIVIEDEARQVDPATIRSRNLEDVRPGGLGVHIIRAVMDDVRYEKRNGSDRGMRLVMIKNRTETASATSSACPGGETKAPQPDQGSPHG